MTESNIIVIGGGAAGLIACAFAARHCRQVILVEKNKILGKKLRITGKGRCNITNAAEIDEFFKNIPTNPKFLYSALYSFTNDDIIDLLKRLGVETKTERGGRIFPVSDNAGDVADALSGFALKKNVKLIHDEAAGLLKSNGRVDGVILKNGRKLYGKVILAAGGTSYPLTGSDGSGFRIAAEAGHTITQLKPSLIPVITSEKWACALAGLSLKNVVLSVYKAGEGGTSKKKKCIFSELGEMLFTHYGVSGPLVLSASAHMRGDLEYVMTIDLKPGLSIEKLNARILRDFEDELNKDVLNGLDKLLPKALIPIVLKLSGIDERKKIHSITKEERMRLSEVIKGLTLTPIGFRPISEAIVTSGGVCVNEINPSTMESKLLKGLYFAGEIIDVDAYTGGFNLQIAWSTGYLAGMNASGAF
ncbi:MAG: NAD(P)/FAD-dependent oxidoreductase [Clostridia bacterium]|nr:NAD(P)/FAD-dependent oxidoreductase [Clostridia bacterium]